MDKHFEIFTDVNRLVFWKGRSNKAPIPVQTKCQILLNGLLLLTKLNILDINEKQKIHFIKANVNTILSKILDLHFLCSVSYLKISPPSPLPFNLRLNNIRPFYAIEIDNFEPLYVSKIYLNWKEKFMN